jgi:hypothetical protein
MWPVLWMQVHARIGVLNWYAQHLSRARTGTYNKTPAWLNDRPVFELLKQGTVSKLYLAVVNGHQSWCIGPNTQVDDAFLRVHDGALLPSAVTSTWTETQPSLQVERRRKGGKAGASGSECDF